MSKQHEWEVKQLKELIDDFIVPMRDKPPYWAGTTPWCRIEDIDGKFLDGSKSNQVVDEKTIKLMNLKVFPVGTVICSCSARLGVCAIISRPLVSNQTFIGLVPGKNIETEYLYYQMTSQADVLQTMSSGTTIAYLPREKFEQFEIKIPKSKTEQAKIAEVLSTVDKAISETEALIAKQQRIKTGLMQDLLTRGIDENGNLRSEETHQFKDSLLGRIPVEWEIKSIGSVLNDLTYGLTIRPKYVEQGIPLISGKECRNGWIDYDICNKITADDFKRLRIRSIPKPDDLLMTKTGTLGRVARIKESDPKSAITQNVALLKPNTELIIPEFLEIILNSEKIQKNIHDGVTVLSIPDLQLGILADFKFSCPDLDEQMLISTSISRINAKALILNKHLIKLRSLKTALMQDLLTGKKRVTPLLENDSIS